MNKNKDFITIKINLNFITNLLGILFIVVGILFIFTILYNIGKSAGYTMGYDSLRKEIIKGYENTSCGDYFNLNNGEREYLRLYKPDCFIAWGTAGSLSK